MERLIPLFIKNDFIKHSFCCFTQIPAPERARLAAELQELYRAGKFDEILARVDACLPRERAELLKDEFTRSMAKLGPLREQIERTARLIDAVVYRLYGLNEEEI